mmetsp:Transcript_46468/g.74485  ORF Transcript_46468/g.74485 Transcript_46468/m.74485 type:complete len:286 (+) Transcript_46468:236-1093(+)
MHTQIVMVISRCIITPLRARPNHLHPLRLVRLCAILCRSTHATWNGAKYDSAHNNQQHAIHEILGENRGDNESSHTDSRCHAAPNTTITKHRAITAATAASVLLHIQCRIAAQILDRNDSALLHHLAIIRMCQSLLVKIFSIVHGILIVDHMDIGHTAFRSANNESSVEHHSRTILADHVDHSILEPQVNQYKPGTEGKASKRGNTGHIDSKQAPRTKEIYVRDAVTVLVVAVSVVSTVRGRAWCWRCIRRTCRWCWSQRSGRRGARRGACSGGSGRGRGREDDE